MSGTQIRAEAGLWHREVSKPKDPNKPDRVLGAILQTKDGGRIGITAGHVTELETE